MTEFESLRSANGAESSLSVAGECVDTINNSSDEIVSADTIAICFHRAKAFLHKVERSCSISLYDHLVDVLYNLLEGSSNDYSIDKFQKLSWRLKRLRVIQKDDNSLADTSITSAATLLSRKLADLFSYQQPRHHLSPVDKSYPQPDLMQSILSLERIGVSLPRKEIYLIQLSINRLISRADIFNVRFWGKVFGLKHNYYIVEAEQTVTDEEVGAALSLESQGAINSADSFFDDSFSDDADEIPIPPTSADYVEPKDPEPSHQAPIDPPPEHYGSGANRKVYFVSNSLCGCWTQLPAVSPIHIQLARKVRKLFSGCLTTPIITYPPFPGDESVYLRAQIARISAATLVSPAGYYSSTEDEDDLGESYSAVDQRPDLVLNEEFEQLSISELSAPDLSGWCHHAAYLLPQGRCHYWRPPTLTRKSLSDEDDEEQVDDHLEEVQDEKGPSLLTPLSEDTPVNGVSAWSIRVSSSMVPAHTLCTLLSNRWPGAVAFSDGSHFTNIYIGWGIKAECERGFSPTAPPGRDECFPPLTDINHEADPTPAAEEAYQRSHEEQEEEEVEEEGEDVYDEDDEDDY